MDKSVYHVVFIIIYTLGNRLCVVFKVEKCTELLVCVFLDNTCLIWMDHCILVIKKKKRIFKWNQFECYQLRVTFAVL